MSRTGTLRGLLPLDVVDWFLLPEPELQLEGHDDPLSPREWLLSGRPTGIVVSLAYPSR